MNFNQYLNVSEHFKPLTKLIYGAIAKREKANKV